MYCCMTDDIYVVHSLITYFRCQMYVESCKMLLPEIVQRYRIPLQIVGIRLRVRDDIISGRNLGLVLHLKAD